MPDRPPPQSPLRPRAPDSAADLGLYAAPLALGIPVMLAASEAAPVQAAAIAPAKQAATESSEKAEPPAFGWWGGDGTSAGASASFGPAASPATSPTGGKAAGDGDTATKVVVMHDSAGLPPAAPPLSNIEPVARTEAPAAVVPAADAAAETTAAVAPDPAGVAALNAVGALTGTALDPATDAVGALVIDAAGLADGVLEAATMLVAETVDGVGGVIADLGLLGGADPLGGIATLVEMVGSADLLGLTDIAAPADGLLVSLGGAGDGLGEALAAPLDLVQAPVDALLGVGAAPGPLGLLAGLTDDTI